MEGDNLRVRRKKVRGIIGIAFMATSVAAMYLWMAYGQAVFATKPVLIAVMDIEEGTLIEPEKHFAVAKVDTDLIIAGSLEASDQQALYGVAAKQFIPKNAQISDQYFTKENLAVTGDKAVFKIPNTWIYAVPSSMRRGDDIDIYEIDSNIEKNLHVNASKSEDEINTYSDQSVIRLSLDAPVLSTTVLYVKDSSNREVVDADERKRFDGTSQIGSVEIACTKKEMKALEKRVADGMMFIIVYH